MFHLNLPSGFSLLLCLIIYAGCIDKSRVGELKELGYHVSNELHGAIHVEPSLAIHPMNDYKMVVASIIYDNIIDTIDRKGKLAFYLSDDGGQTWEHSYTTLGMNSALDPWVSINRNSTIAIVGLGDYSNQNIIVYFSHDWGNTWQYKEMPKFDKRNYDHPTSKFNKEGQLVICASQGNGTGTEGYWGLRQIVLDSDFEVLDSYWHTIPPLDLTPGSFDFTPSDDVLLSFASIADFKDGYQNILDTAHSYSLLFEKTKNYKVKRVAEHRELGSFPVLAIDTSSVSPDYGSAYYTRHILQGSTRRIKLYKSSSGNEDWQEIKLDTLMPPNVDCKESAVLVNNKGVLGVHWRELLSDNCSQLVFAYSKDGGLTFSSKIYLHEQMSCNSTVAHRSLRRPNGRSIVDRFSTGGDYIGFATKTSGEFCFSYPYTKSEVFQLFYKCINIDDY